MSSMNDVARGMLRQGLQAGGGGANRATLLPIAGLPPDPNTTPGAIQATALPMPATQPDDDEARRAANQHNLILSNNAAPSSSDRLGG